VVSIHYRGQGADAIDSSEVGLYFTKETPQKEVEEIAINDDGVAIPAAQVKRIAASVTLKDDGEVVAIRPGTGPLLVSLQVTAYRPDGIEEILLWNQGYQFDWQNTYFLKRPTSLAKGTRIEVVAYFDNTDQNRHNPNSPPKELRASDVTRDALCTISLAKPRSAVRAGR
jgi:hypothetical protein